MVIPVYLNAKIKKVISIGKQLRIAKLIFCYKLHKKTVALFIIS